MATDICLDAYPARTGVFTDLRRYKLGFHKQRIVLRLTEFECFNGPFFMQTRMKVFEFLFFFVS